MGAKQARQIAGRYDLGALLGEGGMARVYRARDKVLGREVAVKLLHPELAKNGELVNRFRSEATAAAKMTHSSIVKVFDAGTDRSDGAASGGLPQPYIVMEHVEGRLLRDLLAEGPLPMAEAVRIAGGVLTALEYSHKAGVIHRDIKPGNVMIAEDGTVKVMDFGIARAANEAGRSVSESDAILGSALYFSPEQAKGVPVDERTDLYSTGVVLFELLTGRPPFLGETPVAIAYQHLSEPVPPLRALNPEVPAAYQAVVTKAMAKQPGGRYRTAAEFQAALAEAVGTGTSSTGIGENGEPEPSPLTGLLMGAEGTDGVRAVQQLAARSATTAPTQKGPPVAWLWAGILLVAAIVVGLVFWIVRLDTTEPIDLPGVVTIPELVGLTERGATNALDALDAKYVVTTRSSDTVAEGLVLETSPRAGERMSTSFAVEIIISSGPQQVLVPPLINLTLTQAKQRLENVGLLLGDTARADSPGVPNNRIISSTPEAGESVVIGTTVDLILSNGRVRLPRLVGMPLADAMAKLNELELRPNPRPDTGCTLESGNPVRSQSPGASSVRQRSTVTLTYCAG